MNEELISSIKKLLHKFDKLDLRDPIMVIGVKSVAMSVLTSVIIQRYPGFSGDVYFNYDPDPYLKVAWWHPMTGHGDEIIFRFKPIRIEGDNSNLIAAYNRAMGVI